MTYQVIDIRTKDIMGTYATRKAASRKADKLDLEYGAIKYAVVPVKEIIKQKSA